MPTYEYLCTSCASKIEVMQSFSDPPLEVCTLCGGKLRKVFHAVGIQFKGGGFYSSDRRAAQPVSRKDGVKVDKKAPSEAGAAADGKAEPKAGSAAGASGSTKGAAEKSA